MTFHRRRPLCKTRRVPENCCPDPKITNTHKFQSLPPYLLKVYLLDTKKIFGLFAGRFIFSTTFYLTQYFLLPICPIDGTSRLYIEVQIWHHDMTILGKCHNFLKKINVDFYLKMSVATFWGVNNFLWCLIVDQKENNDFLLVLFEDRKIAHTVLNNCPYKTLEEEIVRQNILATLVKDIINHCIFANIFLSLSVKAKGANHEDKGGPIFFACASISRTWKPCYLFPLILGLHSIDSL